MAGVRGYDGPERFPELNLKVLLLVAARPLNNLTRYLAASQIVINAF
jgi:hypothetical protein